jgi:PAS domain S-box-containing protein
MVAQDIHWYEELFDAVFQFVAILDEHGKIIKANQAAIQMTGLEQASLTGTALWEVSWQILSKTNRADIKRAVNRAAKGEFVRSELEIRAHNNPIITMDFTFKPILNELNTLKFVIAEGRDISVYKRTSEALYQSRARFATIFDKASLGILIEAPDGKITDCNPAFLAMLGYQIEEIRQRDYLEITHPLDRAASRKAFNELLSGKQESYNLEKRYLAKTGQTVWVSINSSLVRSTKGNGEFIIVMAENITAQKEVEAELIELRQRVMQGREMERLRVAQDLHDGPLQDIIAISYQVKELENTLVDRNSFEQLQAIQVAIQKVTKSIRTICGELRPSTLMPFGLEKAIRSHAEEFQASHTDLLVDLELVHDGQTLPEPVRIALFRIYQEALNNVVRHARAEKVSVRFRLLDDQAFLEVQDNGQGFNLPGHWIDLARKQHLGLVGSIERAREVGGYLEVNTASGKGTQIRVVMPIQPEAHKQSQ